MHGQFAKASELLQAIPAWLRPNNPRMADRIEQEHAELQSVLRTNDPSAIAAHLHAMEERTIAVDGLQRYWRRTPFPFER
jgi:ribosomal protein L39E